MLKKAAYLVLFGNYYLAFCITALSAETAIKNGFFIADLSYYFFVFLSVVVYYTYAYSGDSITQRASNARSLWYVRNAVLIRFTQIIYSVLIAAAALFLVVKYRSDFRYFSVENWLLLLLFPLIALLYYGVIFPVRFRFRLRNVAWLKPFIIGFTCTGIITVYPMLLHALQINEPYHISIANSCYFLTNWLFTTAIAIMFDIKDFVADHNFRLKTFVVTQGLRRTIFFILLPLAAASFLSFVMFAFLKHFSSLQILINIIPFCLLLMAATSLRRRKGILYYLLVIDGLLLVKAAFGICAMLLVK